MLFLDLGPKLFTHENENWLFSESSGPFSAKFCMQAFSYEENKIELQDVGHMTKLAAMLIYVMNLSKYSPEPLDRFSRNFVCIVNIKHIIVCINNVHGLTLAYLT